MGRPLAVFVAFLIGAGVSYSIMGEATVAPRYEHTDTAGAFTAGVLMALLVRAAVRARA